LVQQYPDNPRAHLGLARLAHDRGDLDEALRHAERALPSPVARKAAHVLRATIYQRRNDGQASARESRLAAALPEDRAWPDPFMEEAGRLRVGRRAYLERGEGLMNQRRPAEAV